MSSVNEWVVREYLEALGFLVRQPRKYQVVARSKGLHEEVDLLAVNPGAKGAAGFPEAMLWGARELAQVPGAVVAVRGWHSERFTAAMLASSPEVYRFAEPDSVRAATVELGLENPAKILCMADLPADPDQRARPDRTDAFDPVQHDIGRARRHCHGFRRRLNRPARCLRPARRRAGSPSGPAGPPPCAAGPARTGRAGRS